MRLFPILIAYIIACGIPGSAIAQPSSNSPSKNIARLLEQNQLVADVAHKDPDSLWSLVSKLQILSTAPRDGGVSRSASAATQAETMQIDANPALDLAYRNDPAATLALLRTTNEALGRAHLRGTHDQARRVALVVGSSGDAAWGKLTTTGNDANLVAGALAQQGFELSGGSALIDPDRRHLLQAISDFGRTIEPGTVAIFYFAGHGVQANGRNFIVPSGSAIPRGNDDYDKSLVAIDDIVLRRMQQANALMNIIVLDACRDHPPMVPVGTDAHGRQQSARGLAPMSAPSPMRGTLIMYSTEPNNVARDSVGGEPDSPFATAFAAAIRETGLDIRDVFDRVQRSIDIATNHQQEPWVSYSAIGKFSFNSGPQSVGEIPVAVRDRRPFLCPKAGTTVTLVAAGGTFTGTYQPADPRDAALCSVTTPTGDTRSLLFNFYDPTNLMDQTPVRADMNDILTGRKDQVEFTIMLHRGAVGTTAFYRVTETWTRLGQETLSIAGRYVPVIKFERTRQSVDYGGPRQTWNLWYYPAGGVFIRSELSPNRGPTFGNGGLPGVFEVISVAPP